MSEKVYTEPDLVELAVDEVKSEEVIVPKILFTNKLKRELDQLNKCSDIFATFEPIENDSYFKFRFLAKNGEKVIETKMNFNKIVSSIRQEIPFTHLITIPFNNENMCQQLNRFKDIVLNQYKHCKGIDQNLFQVPEKLHLTVCVLRLFDEKEIIRAKQVFGNCFDRIIKPLLSDKPLRVKVQGLDVMNKNHRRAHVLYAKINDQSNRLQSMVDGIVQEFVDSSLMEKEYESVRLHITLMNSLFRQRIDSRETDPKKSRHAKRIQFDAQNIVQHFKDETFCDLVVDTIELNDIKTKTEKGYYGLIENMVLHKE